MKIGLIRLALIGLFLPAIAHAGQFNNTTVSTILVDEAGVARISVEGGTQITTEASCSQSGSGGRDFTYDLNSPAGNGWHSITLSALATGKELHVVGTGTCLPLAGTPFESIRMLYIIN